MEIKKHQDGDFDYIRQMVDTAEQEGNPLLLYVHEGEGESSIAKREMGIVHITLLIILLLRVHPQIRGVLGALGFSIPTPEQMDALVEKSIAGQTEH